MRIKRNIKITIKTPILFIILIFVNFAFGQASDFNNRPWQNENYPLIVDPYAPNEVDFEKLITDKRVTGLIHQASRGLAHTDNKYKERAETAKQKGLLYASYHLGLKGEPIKQADFYLNVIGENKSQPMALDIEGIGGVNISLPDAELFIKRIYEKTGKYPFVYVNFNVFNTISRDYDKNSVFAKCPLWLAWFGNSLPPQMSKNVWDKVTLWQFASEINCQPCLEKSADGKTCKKKSYTRYTANCPYKISGTLNDIDINAFNGTLTELKEFWINH